LLFAHTCTSESLAIVDSQEDDASREYLLAAVTRSGVLARPADTGGEKFTTTT
jgi:hypothetical protein